MPLDLDEETQMIQSTPTEQQGTFEWYTPPRIAEAAREALGGEIELDPAASERSQQIIAARRAFTVVENGLVRTWQTPALYTCPPFDFRAEFAFKLIASFQDGLIGQAVFLMVAEMDADWAQALTLASSAICFPRGRVTYIDGQTMQPASEPAPQAQAIWYLGHGPRRFAHAFREIGAAFATGRYL